MLTSGGLAFYERVFTPAEQRVYGYMPSSLAACFAGKEAVSKVLGTGLSIGEPDRVSCTDIEILPGEPLYVHLFNEAQRIAHQLDLATVVVRCFFTGPHIVAVAAGTSRDDHRDGLLNCIEQVGAQITSQMSHQKG